MQHRPQLRRSMRVLAAGTAALALAMAPLTAQADTSAPPAPVANAITVTSTGDNYQISGHLSPGTGTISWVNADDEMHMMEVARLQPGTTVKKLLAALNSENGEQAASKYLADGPTAAYGGPGLLTAGQGETVTMTGLQPGKYVLVCFMVDADGTPHYNQGMITTLNIRGAEHAEAPTSVGTIDVNDTGINLPQDFTGQGTYAITNTGAAPHSFSLAELDPGVGLAQFAGSVGEAMMMGTQPQGGGLIAGVETLSPGQTSYVTLSLTSGHYGYVSTEDIAGPDLPPQSGEFDIP